MRALTRQISWFKTNSWLEGKRAASIFFGGGTPTILPAKTLTQLLSECCRSFSIQVDKLETTVECNPATLNKSDLLVLRKGGFNRLSIGIQSLNEKELLGLSRPHSAEEAKETVLMAEKVGFDNISIDLMFGLPGQTPSSWSETLKKAIGLGPDHMSIYELTIEGGTRFYQQLQDRTLLLPDEETVLQMMEITENCLAGTQYQRYEISNYSIKDKQCLHNLNYWRNGSYIGLGAGAFSNLSGLRLSAFHDIELYCQQIENNREPWSEKECLDNEAGFRETVVMGLRTLKGIALEEMQQRFQIDLVNYYGDTLNKLIRQNLLELTVNTLRLTKKGLLVANMVMAELV